MKANFRFWWGDVLICLPLVTSVAGGWFFAQTVLPTWEKREAELIRGHYREIAAEIREEMLPGVQYCQPQRLKPEGRLAQGTWGHESVASGELVWYRPYKANQHLGLVVPPRIAYDYRRGLAWAGAFLLAILLLLTDLGLRFFRRRSEERDDFLAAAAHDLATPLVAMRRLIGRDDATAKILNERMIHLVENIRDYLRLGGRRQVTLTDFPIGRAFDEAYALLADDFADADSGPVIPTGDRDARVRADQTMTVQVFWNLLSNELKYASAFGPITVSFKATARHVEVVLADSGPGMSGSVRRHIFDRYFRAQSALKSGSGGFGIGLANARDFARQMGGELTVEVHPPAGSAFRWILSAP